MKKCWLFFTLILISCHPQRQEIEFALKEAGENRKEIEAVLLHYEKGDVNPLKFQAARYLIRYMPYHFSYGEEIKDYYRAVDSVIACSDNKLEQEKCIKALHHNFEDKYVLNNDWVASNISDDNQLTNFRVKGDDYWVGFDFGQPVNVSKISYIRRCDGNSVQPGLDYSLYYWNNCCWQLIGTKTANDVFVEFEKVPRKALLAIKCSQGDEQRIFICDENNKVHWY